ncbi:MAG TPA: hypothetical protein VEH76_05945 [Methylocystis sp.]|nr:hypothetical protein [Methylocystis sp.]
MQSTFRHGAAIRAALTALALFGAFAPSAALPAGWHYYDPECPIALGGKTMKFVAMQPKHNIDRVCDQLPDLGPTVIALDAADAELREMSWDIRVLHDTGRAEGEENLEADTLFRLPVEKHRNGMINFDHTFTRADKYLLLVKMTSDDGARQYVGRHQFTVGLMDDSELYAWILFAAFLVAVGGGLAYFYLRRRKAATSP